MPRQHIQTFTVFNCPRVRFVRDDANHCLEIRLGTTRITVFGEDTPEKCPDVVEQTPKQANDEDLRLLTRAYKEDFFDAEDEVTL